MTNFGHRGRTGRCWGALAAALLIPSLGSGAESQFGKVSLKSGEAIRAAVAKTLSDGYILLTPDGLRAVSKDMVSAIAPPGSPEALDLARTESASKSSPPASAGPASSAPRADPPAKALPKPDAPKTGDAPKGDSSKGVAPKGDGGKGAPPLREISADVVPVIMMADKRIDDARAGGPSPVIEIALGGTIDAKPVNPLDPLTMPRLSFFFSKESLPKFEVLMPPGLRQEKLKTAKGAVRAAEYLARITEDTGMMELTFYGTSVLRKCRSNMLLELARASDKKVIVRINAVEDLDGEPENHGILCRETHERALKALLERLKSLKTFGGSSSGSEINGNAPSSARR